LGIESQFRKKIRWLKKDSGQWLHEMSRSKEVR